MGIDKVGRKEDEGWEWVKYIIYMYKFVKE